MGLGIERYSVHIATWMENVHQTIDTFPYNSSSFYFRRCCRRCKFYMRRSFLHGLEVPRHSLKYCNFYTNVLPQMNIFYCSWPCTRLWVCGLCVYVVSCEPGERERERTSMGRNKTRIGSLTGWWCNIASPFRLEIRIRLWFCFVFFSFFSFCLLVCTPSCSKYSTPKNSDIYACSWINSWSRTELAPIKRSTTSPALIKTNVGIALTLYLAATSGSSSTSTLTKTTLVMSSLSSWN